MMEHQKMRLRLLIFRVVGAIFIIVGLLALSMLITGCQTVNSYSTVRESVVKVGNARSSGSAVSLGNGLFLTAFHTTMLEVLTKDGEVYPFTLVVGDEEADLAVVSSDLILPAVVIATREVHELERVYSMGFPFGEPLTVSQGIVSRKCSMTEGRCMVQHTAATFTGVSGGGLFNENMELVGIILRNYRVYARAPFPVLVQVPSMGYASTLADMRALLDGV